MENKEIAEYGDDLEKALDRFSYEDEDCEDTIKTEIVKEILDHFVPKWRKREDRYYKLKKFVTEQQLDTNINKLRNYIDNSFSVEIQNMKRELTKMRERMDEFDVSAQRVKMIIEADEIATQRIMMKYRKYQNEKSRKG